MKCTQKGDFIEIEGMVDDVETAKHDLSERLMLFSSVDDVIEVKGEKAFLIKTYMLDDFYQLLYGVQFQRKDTMTKSDMLKVSISGSKRNIQSVKNNVASFVDRISVFSFSIKVTQNQYDLIKKSIDLYQTPKEKIKTFEKENRCIIEMPVPKEKNDTDHISKTDNTITIPIDRNTKIHIKRAMDVTSEGSNVLVCTHDASMKHRTAVLHRFELLCSGISEEV